MVFMFVDTREDAEKRKEWEDFQKTKKDLDIEFTSLKTGDVASKDGVMEIKHTVDDLISSEIWDMEREDGTTYERLNEQLDRLILDPRPVKVLMVIGDMDERYSAVHENSVCGIIAKVPCKGSINDAIAGDCAIHGVSYIQITDSNNYMEIIYRIFRMAEKLTGSKKRALFPYRKRKSVATGTHSALKLIKNNYKAKGEKMTIRRLE